MKNTPMIFHKITQNKWLQNVCSRLHKILFYDHWMIGIVDQPIAYALTWTTLPPVKWIEAPQRDRYLADPFPWPGSADTLMCEEYDIRERKGHISALRLRNGNIIDEIKSDLPFTGHLSFPLLFMQGGRLFMMPESGADRRLEILAWDDHRWVSHSIIMEGISIADAVFFEKNELLWIAYTDITHDPHDNLNLIYAEDLRGPWYAHAANPVRRGADVSRNGGGVFAVGGKIYRPAQDCSRVYGGSLRIMEIVTCTPDVYAEKEITHIVPSSRDYPDGFHTLSAWGDRCLVDGMRMSFSWRVLAGKFLRRMRIVR